jgi:hypothetical protein
MSRLYILLSSFNEKRRFRRLISQKVRETACFFTICIHSGQHGGVFDSFDSLHNHPLPGHSPRQQLVDQAVFEPPSQSLPLSKWRYWASDYGCAMMLSLPLSYWSPGRSYMTSSRTAMSIYIAARIRVKYNFCFVLISSLIVNVISALFLVSCTISVISQKAVVELKNILSQPDSQGSTPGKLLLNLKSFENHSWKSKVICDCSYER